MSRTSKEALRLRAVSQLRQAGRFATKNPQPEIVPIPVKKRAEAHLWGKIPTQAMLVLREQPDKTVRVYSALCTLLQGKTRMVQVAEIAYLSLLKDRSAREHLKRLKKVGLIDYKASMHGPSVYWLTTPCASNECTRDKHQEDEKQSFRSGGSLLPDRSGGQLPPNKDQIIKIKSFTPTFPTEKGGKVISTKLEKRSFFPVDDYFSYREKYFTTKNRFESVCNEIVEELEFQQAEENKAKAVEQAVVESKIPQWWVEMIDFLPMSKSTQSILMEAVPRERVENTISIGMPRFFAGLANQRKDDLEAAFSQLNKCDIFLKIAGDKAHDEISVADIHSNVALQKIDLSQVRQSAKKKLGWKAEPTFEELESIERYGQRAKEVCDLAKRVGEGNALPVLEKWLKYPVPAVVRLMEFEKEKSRTEDPVRNYKHWWKKTLGGIVEKLESTTN